MSRKEHFLPLYEALSKIFEEEKEPANIEMNILKIEEKSSMITKVENKRGISITVQVKNSNENENITLNPLYFTLETGEGKRYSYYSIQANKPEGLAPKSETTFWIMFGIPKDETEAVLKYEPILKEPISKSLNEETKNKKNNNRE